MWRVDEILTAVQGVAFRIERETFSRISTDSRSIQEGEFFVPIRGKTYDGHRFIDAAYDKSRGGALCEKGSDHVARSARGTIILVNDTTQALLDLARYKRERTEGTFIAITGSNGKTTTKEILVGMIGGAWPVHYNEKNFNNLIGVSTSILALEGNPRFSVFELGTNAKGEIRRLTEVTEPDVSLITNINPSHLEGLVDIQGVLEEKLDLFYLTKAGGTILVNADDPHILPHYKDAGHALYTYSIKNAADFRLMINDNLGWEGFRITLNLGGNQISARTSLLGEHNLYNILAAASIARVVGLDMQSIRGTVETFSSYGMRFKPLASKKGYVVVDDTYNANPSSMEWAVNTLASLPCTGKRIAVIGDMAELGEKTAFYHREMGRFLAGSNIPVVLLIGGDVHETYNELGPQRARLFDSKPLLIDYVRAQAREGDVILVKGSRASKMEEIVEALI
jgi:UDP-N-acetylmuramoyl-tripeptide--D-alanyl-D-alanine ligase